MRFLLDQDVYALTARFLQELGHDVVLASELGLARASDEVLLITAQMEARIFVTRDRDYGNLVFVKAIQTGVLYLRILPSTQQAIHQQLRQILTRFSERELAHLFVVVEADGYRLRRLDVKRKP